MRQNCEVNAPSAETRKPVEKHTIDTNIAQRGPLRSTRVPPKAADRPSITIALSAMTSWLVRGCPRRFIVIWAEQPVLDLVPCGGARRQVADGDGQPDLRRQR